ncbi:DUF454 family protein [Spongiibacter marinus]|uniref:DUF454 family protein n=1 Tax=Spongiibacter marinus TaxID=354246 RepID=UPI0006860799|nr:DUF454 family protein [Spongiibacter marinus]
MKAIEATGVARMFYLSAGLLFLLLALAGVFLPLLPTTPFLLLTAACFSKSSERCHQRLLASRLFGPTIKRWERQRCVNCRTKWIAVFSMLAVGGCSVVFAVPTLAGQIACAALMAVGGAVVISLKTCISH